MLLEKLSKPFPILILKSKYYGYHMNQFRYNQDPILKQKQNFNSSSTAYHVFLNALQTTVRMKIYGL